MVKVFVSDALEPEGLEILQKTSGIETINKPGLAEDDLCKHLADVEGLIVRSGTKVTAKVLQAAPKLKWVGRAGIGVDNVDVEAASRRGVIVSNTPTGNMVTTAEHALSLMFSLARQVPQATASMKAGKWEKKKFKGVELFGKTLGLIGVGNIGKIVADRAIGLKMKVVGYDPFLSEEKAKAMGIELVSLDDLFGRADVISVHTPLTDQTRGIVGRSAFAKMRKGVLVINAARGGIVDEAALLEALNSGQCAGAALDVFVEEPPAAQSPLVAHPNVICTPHLGAATAEAQLNVAIQVAEQAVDYFKKGEIRNAVNIPAVPAGQAQALAPYLTLAEKMASFHSQLQTEGFDEVEVEYSGDVTKLTLKPITLAVLKGLLQPTLGESSGINLVNAPLLAAERGIKVKETTSPAAHDYTTLVRIRTRRGTQAPATIEGTVFGTSDPRVVAVGNYRIETPVQGTLLVFFNKDEPGAIGEIGGRLARAKVNIAGMSLGRESAGGKAMAILSIDQAASEDVIEDLLKAPQILSVRQIRL